VRAFRWLRPWWRLGIAEGIETAAAASLGSGLPVVAAYCANALAGFAFPVASSVWSSLRTTTPQVNRLPPQRRSVRPGPDSLPKH
jgi:hypothetical protein